MSKFSFSNKGFLAVLLIVLFFVVGFSFDDFFQLSRNMEIFGQVYKEVNAVYVDETDPTQLMRTAIDSMLKTLDPYTVFYSESQIDQSQLISTGQYISIGATIGKRKGKVLVLQLFQDGPADKAGLDVGDEILRIDELKLSDHQFNLNQINNLLYGEKGSAVTLQIRRNDIARDISIQRGGISEASKENVPYFGMANDTIGYIMLTGFTANAGGEVNNALRSLKKDHSRMNRVILDLRGNPGGRLIEAVNIVNAFVAKGIKIAEMKGKTPENQKEFYTLTTPFDEDLPVAVLVDRKSASASEIVSGALQDLDRAVIVGERSFGKGLVQNFREFATGDFKHENRLKITIAKYFTPSGRCIQSIDYFTNDDGTAEKVAKEQIQAFKTRNGRTVYDGGGVLPDVEVPNPDLRPVTKSLVDQGYIFDFATAFNQNKLQIAPPQEFTINDSIYAAFLSYVEDRGFEFATQSEKQITALEQAIEEAGHKDELNQELTSLREKLESQKSKDLQTHRDEIAYLLKEEIITRYFYKQGLIEASFTDDPVIQAALEVLNDMERYKNILSQTR